jgi:hypothetical protein
MSSIASASPATWLQSQTPASNWVQSAVTSDSVGSADWMDPNGGGTDPVDLAANAFAAAEQTSTQGKSSLAVNQGISVLSSQLTGQSVNILA